jgi:UDP:flavonoid glycosyltransferase YjiC (YdhE family)
MTTTAERPYVLFACVPAVGHVRPLLAQARSLARRGFRVALASFDEVAPVLASEAPDIPFLSAGRLESGESERDAVAAAATAEPDFLKGLLRSYAGFSQETWGPLFDLLLREMARARPDVLVADFATPAALDAADAMGVPALVNNPDLLAMLPPGLLPAAPHVPLPFSGQSIDTVSGTRRVLTRAAHPLFVAASRLAERAAFGRTLNAQRKTRGLAATSHEAQLRGRTIMVNCAFGLEYVRPLAPGIEMVGPMLDADEPALPPAWLAWLAEGPSVVYASLGTIALPSPERLAVLVEGLAAPGTRVLLAVRRATQARLPARLPPQLRVVEWVPSQRRVLAHPNVRAFVSHCGINSVHESVAGDTPIVGIPMVADQLDMAVRVADAGVGLKLDKGSFSARELRAAIEDVLRDGRYRAPLAGLRESFEAAGGVARAVSLIAAAAT